MHKVIYVVRTTGRFREDAGQDRAAGLTGTTLLADTPDAHGFGIFMVRSS